MLEDEERLRGWLSLFQGPGYRGQKARDTAIAEMQAAGPERLFPLLAALLAGADPETRCIAIQAALWIDARQGQELVLPLRHDPAQEVRWCVCWCLHDFGDERAVPALIQVLESDPDSEVRGAAAYALGGIGSSAAIPALLLALDADPAWDVLRQSPGAHAATALDEILRKHAPELALAHLPGTLHPGHADLSRLKQLATEFFHQWSGGAA